MMHEEDSDLFEFHVDDSLVEYDQDFHLQNDEGIADQQIGSTGGLDGATFNSASGYNDKDVMLLVTTCLVVGVSIAILWWRTDGGNTRIMSLSNLNEAIKDNMDLLKDDTNLDVILEEVLSIDAELKKNSSTMQTDTLNQLHTQLEKIDSLLADIVENLQDAEHSSAGSYLDCLQQVRMSDLISRINSVLQPAKSDLDRRLHAHVKNSLQSMVLTMEEDLAEGNQLVHDLYDIQKSENSVISLGDNTFIDFELKTRRIVSGIEHLKTYDLISEYAELRERARTFVTKAYLLEDAIEEQLHKERSSNELLSMKANFSSAVQLTGGGNLTGAEADKNESASDDAAGVNLNEMNTPGKNKSAIVSSAESPTAIVQNSSSNPAVSNLYSNYIIQAQNRSNTLMDDFLRKEDSKRQNRLTQRIEGERSAEIRLRQDQQSERDEKNKLESLNVQRSILRKADKSWAEERKKVLSRGYEDTLATRNRWDTFLFTLVTILSIIFYSMTVFQCQKEPIKMKDLALEKVRSLCVYLSDTCTQEVQIENGAFELDYGYKNFEEGSNYFFSSIPKQIYGQVSAYSSISWGWMTSNVLGMDLDMSWLISDLTSCLFILVYRLCFPIIFSQMFLSLGLFKLSNFILVFGLLCSLFEPIQKTFGFLRQFSVFLIFQWVFYVILRVYDTNLNWYLPSKKSKHVAIRNRKTKRYDTRRTLLWFLYPTVCVFVACFLGCAVASQSFSRGLQVGQRQGFLDTFNCVGKAAENTYNNIIL